VPLAGFLSRWLPLGAVILTLAGALDPLEGFPIVLIGGVLTLMAALQAQGRNLRLAIWGLGLAATGSAAMVALSLAGGVGPAAGRSEWWLAVVAPYPVGVALFLAADILILRARSRVP
jgi:hypothetical protein